jgi:protein-tyrosine phosphatase
MNVLVMCTANRCRSPIVEGLLKRAVSSYPIGVSSAGFLESGHRAPSEGIRAVAKAGVDISSHISRQVTVELLDEADLIIVMEVAHLMTLAGSVPSSFPRAFTLPELDEAWQQPNNHQSLNEAVTSAALNRNPGLLMSRRAQLDIADPMGRRMKQFDKTVELVNPMIARIAARLIRFASTSFA